MKNVRCIQMTPKTKKSVKPKMKSGKQYRSNINIARQNARMSRLSRNDQRHPTLTHHRSDAASPSLRCCVGPASAPYRRAGLIHSHNTIVYIT